MEQKTSASTTMMLLTVCIAQFMAPFMLTAIGVALPALGRDLGASAMQIGLVEQCYMLSLAMFMLAFGRLSDIIGQRIIFLMGLFAFTLFTFFLGYATTIFTVIVLRFFQGLGASMFLSGSMALVATAYPPMQRARKIGLVSACTYIGLSIGPVVGGYVTLHFGWRHIFLMPVPIGIAAILTGLFGMKEPKKNASGERMDWKGSLIYALSVGSIMIGATHVSQRDGILLLLAGVVGMGLFLVMESRNKSPILDVKLLSGNRFFTLSCLAALGNYAATFGIVFFMSLFLQYAKGLTARQAGFILLLQPLMQVLTSLLAGRLAGRIAVAKLATVGMLISAVGLLLTAFTIGVHIHLWLVSLELMLIGAGFGIFVTPNSAAIMDSVERRQYGVASGMIGAMRTLGMATSLTTITLVFSLFLGDQAVTDANLPRFLLGMQTALVVFSAFSCLGVILSLSRGKERPA
ncbi:MAG: MFS transporter [Desulfobulbus sp.]|nr:MFS transporter [Desulfobulbus sp.]